VSILIALPSCHSLRYWHESIRHTWGRDVKGADLRFFLGLPKVEAQQDEVSLEVGDSLPELSHKTVAIFRWALSNNYDFCLKADLDTLVFPDRFMNSGFEACDWTGGQNSFFASGGAGYVLSRKAMQIVVDYPVTTTTDEDVHTAKALLEQGINLHHDPRYLFIPGQTLTSETITYHLSSVKAWGAKATPEELRQAYRGSPIIPVKETRWQGRLRKG